MQTTTLAATKRTITGKPVKKLRLAGRMPANLYGFDISPTNIEVDAVSFGKVLATAGESTLVDVVVDGAAPVKALISEVQYHPLSGRAAHADLRAVNMKEKITAEILLALTGEAPIAKSQGAVVTMVHDTIEVECLPSDLVHEIAIDALVLTEIGQTIRVRDLKLPAGMTAMADADDVIVTVSAALTEEQIKAMETAAVGDVSQVEVVEKKKTEEEGAEEAGAAPAEAAKKEGGKKE